MDNYYTSPTLFTSLQQLGFGACGTVRVNRHGMPKEVTAAKLKKGEMTTSEVKKGMLALKWQDKRAVVMLSTIHDDSRVTKRRRTRLVAGGIEEVQKPTMVEKYMYMGGVDKGDQLMSYYGFSHRTVKWWRRALFHLFENAIVNSYILYRLYRMGVKWTTNSLGLSSPSNLQMLTIKLALLAVISMLSLLQLD